jgi:putative N6-adenine-specific DNA methylase
MVKCLAVTDKGIETVTSLELKERIDAEGTIADSCVLFDAKEDDAFRFCYLTQSTDRVILFLDSFKFDDYQDLLKKSEELIRASDLSPYFAENSSFRIYCERRGLHDFNSNSLEQEVGGFVIDRIKTAQGFEPSVELKSPDVMIYVFINQDAAYFGIDLAGRDLSKRHYRIFTAPGIVNAKIAYAIAVLAGYSKGERMVDLFSKAGLMPIEAALHANNVSINYYNKDFIFKKIPAYKDRDWDMFFKGIDSERSDSAIQVTGYDPLLRNLEAAKKNAKLAGVDKFIRFSKMDLDWMDSKLDASVIDLVVSRIPVVSHHLAEGAARKIYVELFHQAEFFLKPKGRLCLLAENLALLREMVTADFKPIAEHRLWAGQQEYEFMILERVPKSGDKE